jgi:hypothetical protein
MAPRPGLIRSIILSVWGLVVLLLFLAEHPTIFTINPFSDLRPILSGLSPIALVTSLGGILAATAVLLWAGLLGRTILGESPESEVDAAADPASPTPSPFLPGERALAAPIACGLGLAIAYLLVFACGALGLLGLPLLLAFGASLALLLFLNRDLLKHLSIPGLPETKTDRILILVLAGCLFAGLVMSLSPLVATDPLVYHMEIPRRYVEAGRIVPLTFNVYANMPHATELLYTLGMLTGGEAGAKCLDFGFRVLLILALVGFTRRWLGTRRVLLAPCLLLTNPLVLDNRTVANIDLAMALFLLLALVQILRWRETGLLRHLVLASLFAGVLSGMKYTGVLFTGALFATLVSIVALDRSGRGGWLGALVFPFPAFLAFLPWLIKNRAFTGDPFYPLLPEVYDTLNWNVELGERLLAWQREMGMGRGIDKLLVLPWNMTIRGNLGYPAFDGILSPLYLMWIPALVLARPLPKVATALVILLLLSLGLWAWGPQQLRFFMPALPLLSLLGAHAIDRLLARAGILWFARLVLWSTLAYLALFTVRVLGNTVPNQLPSAIGLERREDYLHRRLQPYDAMVRANRELPRQAKLLLVWENRGYYLDRPYIADSFYEASWIMQLLEKDQEGNLLAEKLKKEGVTHVLMNVLLGKHFGRAYNPRVREALDRFVRERGKTVFEVNGLVLAELGPRQEADPRAAAKKKTG